MNGDAKWEEGRRKFRPGLVTGHEAHAQRESRRSERAAALEAQASALANAAELDDLAQAFDETDVECRILRRIADEIRARWTP